MIERDPAIDREDREYADRCEKVLRFLVAGALLPGLGRDRPRSTAPAPGAGYQTYVEEEYRRELRDLKHTPTPKTLKRIRKRVLHRAERQFPPESRGELEAEWYTKIEAEKPWRRG